MKERIIKWFFKKEYEDIKREREKLSLLRDKVEMEVANADIVDLMRKRLKGVNTEVKYFEDLEEGEMLVFCAEAKKIFDTKVFGIISSRLISEQKDLSITEAKDLNEVNFGRGTINGITVFYDEVGRLAAIYEELKRRGDAFDKFEVV